MDKLWKVDWEAMFVPAMGLGEIVLRGTLMYLVLFAILRFMGRRQAGHFGPADLLVIVLIADAAQNALGAEYRSITEGALLVLTIVTWEYCPRLACLALSGVAADLEIAPAQTDRERPRVAPKPARRNAQPRRTYESVARRGDR